MEDIVTEVSTEKRRVRLMLNGEEALWFPRAAYLERPLAQDEAVDGEELREWLLLRQYPEALEKAVAFLAQRARSEREIRLKLESRGYMEQTVDMVLCKLETERLTDDEGFARQWIASRLRRGIGKTRILQELSHKGVARDVAQRLLSEEREEDGSEPAIALAQKLLKRYHGEEDPRKCMQKTLAAMARRGFSFSEASDAVKAALERENELR